MGLVFVLQVGKDLVQVVDNKEVWQVAVLSHKGVQVEELMEVMEVMEELVEVIHQSTQLQIFPLA